MKSNLLETYFKFATCTRIENQSSGDTDESTYPSARKVFLRVCVRVNLSPTIRQILPSSSRINLQLSEFKTDFQNRVAHSHEDLLTPVFCWIVLSIHRQIILD